MSHLHDGKIENQKYGGHEKRLNDADPERSRQQEERHRASGICLSPGILVVGACRNRRLTKRALATSETKPNTAPVRNAWPSNVATLPRAAAPATALRQVL